MVDSNFCFSFSISLDPSYLVNTSRPRAGKTVLEGLVFNDHKRKMRAASAGRNSAIHAGADVSGGQARGGGCGLSHRGAGRCTAPGAGCHIGSMIKGVFRKEPFSEL